MNLVSRAQVEALTAYRGNGALTVSFYMDTDKSRRSRREIMLSFKKLVTDARGRVERLDLGRDSRESLELDLEAIGRFGTGELGGLKSPGVAIFACHRKKVWEVLELPHGPRDRIHFESSFYVRPLAAILDRYRRVCALTLDRREARWFDVYMGGIAPVDRLESETPPRIRGVAGTETKRMERHAEARVEEHLKAVARKTFDLFHSQRFDWLAVGCEETLRPAFEAHLHTYLRDRLKGRLKARVADPPAAVLKETVEIEDAVRGAEEADLVTRLVGEIEKGGRACSGLRETLRRLNLFEVQTLVVSHNLTRPGRICPDHRFLYVDEAVCPICDRKTEVVQDVIDEAIEAAVAAGLAVRQVAPPSKLSHYGDVGAFLKYKS